MRNIKIKTKKIIILAMIVMVLCAITKITYAADGDTTWQGDWTFSKNTTSKTITLTKYNGAEETYKVPAKAVIDGEEYSVILGNGSNLSNKPLAGSIKNLSVDEGVKINNLNYLFYQATNLESVDLTGADTSSATSVQGIFYGATNVKKVVLSGLNLSNVTNVKEMFRQATKLEEVDFSNTDMSKVTSFAGSNPSNNSNYSSPFYGANNLKKVNFNNFNTASLTSASGMFKIIYRGENKLESLDVTNWNTRKVTSFESTFENCANLETIEGIGTLDTSSATSFWLMFSSCAKLKELPGIGNWNTSNVTNMSSMFSGAKNVDNLDLSGWNTESVTNLGSMFSAAENLKNINVSTWNTSNVTKMNEIFKGCASLEVLDLSGWTTDSIENTAHSHMSEMLGVANSGNAGDYKQTPLKEITLNENFKFALFQTPGLRSGYWHLKDGTEEETSRRYTPARLYTAYNNGVTPPDGYTYSHTYILTELDPAEAQYYARGWGNNNVWEIHYPDDKFKGYCINLHRGSPNGYYDRTSVNNNSIINDGFLDSDNYGWEPLGNNMEEALITLIYYGWGNDADGIQEKYGLTDSEYMLITQQAIWDFTDRYNNMAERDRETKYGKAHYELISKRFSDIPNGEDLKLYLYESIGGQQNLLAISGLNDQAYAGVRVLKLAPGEDNAFVGLQGAEFIVYDSNNNEICTIISDENGYATKYNTDSIYGIPEGVYTIRETKAPRGYNKLNTYYTFIVRKEDDNEIILVGKLKGNGDDTAMIFENTENTAITGGGIKIKKIDENGNIVRGAKFAIYDGDTEIRRLTTGDDGTAMTAKKELELNKTYTIKEIEAPEGYRKTSEEKTFTLTENGKYHSTVFSFTNELKRGKVLIEGKKVLNNGTLEKGQFEFELIDNEGNIIKTVQNDEDGNIKFEVEYTGEEIGYKTYKIREIKGTNDNIEYDNHEEEIIVYISDNGDEQLECNVEYDSDGVVFKNTEKEQEIEQEPEQEAEYEKDIELETPSPKTGDDSNILLWIIMMLISLIGVSKSRKLKNGTKCGKHYK